MNVLTLNLTRGESRMKVRLMVLPNALSGGAWPSSSREMMIMPAVRRLTVHDMNGRNMNMISRDDKVRVVRCPVKSGNRLDDLCRLIKVVFPA